MSIRDQEAAEDRCDELRSELARVREERDRLAELKIDIEAEGDLTLGGMLYDTEHQPTGHKLRHQSEARVLERLALRKRAREAEAELQSVQEERDEARAELARLREFVNRAERAERLLEKARSRADNAEALAARYREALEEAERCVASVLSVKDELHRDVILELEKARAALASPPEEQNG